MAKALRRKGVRSMNSKVQDNFAVTETSDTLAEETRRMATKVLHGNPSIYKLPTKEVLKDETSMTRKCVFGPCALVGTSAKTIMMVGATGSGKSTHIDGMVNYIFDVKWDNDFRFKLVSLTADEKKREGNQALSQTEWVTCYTINKMEGSKIPYTLNIIDTPGFGDTRGITRDKKLVDQIRQFFLATGDNGIDTLDAVCFVTQAPLARLTATQMYIFDSILAVFGKDIAENIFVLITFADGNEPPVLACLKEAKIPFTQSFCFNNSALFANKVDSERAMFSSMFWKMGEISFGKFFSQLQTVKAKSLQLTQEVLQERQQLEACIQGLQPQIKAGLSQMDVLRQEQRFLEEDQAKMEANKDFTYTVTVPKTRKVTIPAGQHVTNCLVCNRTCHFPCYIPEDKNKASCAAMKQGYCAVCPLGCIWSNHYNQPYRFIDYEENETRTYEDLKKRYQEADNQSKQKKGIIGRMMDEMNKVKNFVQYSVKQIHKAITKLQSIALHPNPLSTVEYIDLMIESEKYEAKPGYEKRIKSLHLVRKEAELVADVQSKGTNFDPFNK